MGYNGLKLVKIRKIGFRGSQMGLNMFYMELTEKWKLTNQNNA